MTNAARAILKQALRLDPVQRAELIDKLFHGFDAAPDARLDAAWAAEAESRIDACRAGKLPAVSAEAAFARLSRRKR